ncbi:DUF7503 family protein [Natronorubrum aibiense]|nr:hypothetical protein [Natronorubrum aibiense]
MDDLTQHLKNHPRMIGALFTILLVLSQASTVAATNSAFAGP